MDRVGLVGGALGGLDDVLRACREPRLEVRGRLRGRSPRASPLLVVAALLAAPLVLFLILPRRAACSPEGSLAPTGASWREER